MSRRRRQSWKKRLLAAPAVVWPLCLLASLVMRAMYYSNRIEKHLAPESLPYWQGAKPAIFCFWHGRMLAHLFVDPPHRRMHVLSSRHRDGMLVSTLMRCFGIHTVSGSKSRGAAAALRAMLQLAERGQNISITPDGPRGPFQQAAEGAAYLAAKSGYAILPVTFAASRHARLRSWDRFMLFKPFGRICFVTAEPLRLPPDADEAAITAATTVLQDTLTRITIQADRHCGLAP